MTDPNTITAYETPKPGQPVRPPGLSLIGKCRWGARHPPADPSVSFAGKTVLVTGSNTGLGFEAAVKYSALGANKLILGVRTSAKGEATKARILARTGRSPESITFLTVDLSTFASVQEFCAALEKEVAPTGLDVALLSAGVAPPGYKLSPEGWDTVLQVNVLSTALMGLLVIPLLRKRGETSPGSTPHLAFVNSNSNDLVKREWLAKHGGSALKTANDPKAWSSFRTYAISKLMELVVMKGMADMTAMRRDGRTGPEVIVNAVCPGLCKTDIGRDHLWIAQALMAPVQRFLHRTAEEGGRSLVSATVLGSESHGKFWHNDLLYP